MNHRLFILASLGFVIFHTQTTPTYGQAKPREDLHAMELKFQENALSAKKSYVGTPVKFQVFVTKVDEKNGKPFLQANIVYFQDGMQLYCDVWLNRKTLGTALSLKPADNIVVSGVLKKREVLSKDEVQYSGYTSSVYNGSGGGGSVSGGTVTRSWSVYTIDNANVTLLQSAAAKAKAEADVAKKEAKIQEIWIEAIKTLDTNIAQKAVNQGLPSSYVDAAISEISSRDPSVQIYENMLAFYDWCLRQKGINAGNAVGKAFEYKRPRLVEKIITAGGINFRYVFPNGDNILHYLLKDNLLLSSTQSSKSLKLYFSDADAEIIELICKSKLAKGLGDQKDQYGTSPKEYLQKTTENNLLSTNQKGLARIRAAVIALD